MNNCRQLAKDSLNPLSSWGIWYQMGWEVYKVSHFPFLQISFTCGSIITVLDLVAFWDEIFPTHQNFDDFITWREYDVIEQLNASVEVNRPIFRLKEGCHRYIFSNCRLKCVLTDALFVSRKTYKVNTPSWIIKWRHWQAMIFNNQRLLVIRSCWPGFYKSHQVIAIKVKMIVQADHQLNCVVLEWPVSYLLAWTYFFIIRMILISLVKTHEKWNSINVNRNIRNYL